MPQCIFVIFSFSDFGLSAEVSSEVTGVTFHDTSIQRPVVFLSDNHTFSE